jgi:hypothetical protein
MNPNGFSESYLLNLSINVQILTDLEAMYGNILWVIKSLLKH